MTEVGRKFSLSLQHLRVARCERRCLSEFPVCTGPIEVTHHMNPSHTDSGPHGTGVQFERARCHAAGLLKTSSRRQGAQCHLINISDSERGGRIGECWITIKCALK